MIRSRTAVRETTVAVEDFTVMDGLSTDATVEPLPTSIELSDNVVTTENTIDKGSSSLVSDKTVTAGTPEKKTITLHHNLNDTSATETSNSFGSKEATANVEQTSYTNEKNSMLSDSVHEAVQSTTRETNSSVTKDTMFEHKSEGTDTHTTASETWNESSKLTRQMKSDVDTTAEIRWLDVTTQSGTNVSNFQGGFNNTEATTVAYNADGQVNCNSVIIILSSVFVVVLLLVSIGCLYGLYKLRRTWRRKFDEEKRKADIWTKAETDNTIVNENYDFNDIEIRTHAAEHLRQPEIDPSMPASGTIMSSAATRISTASTGSRLSKLLPSKLFIGRSKSSYSDDSLEVKDPNARGRASTFAHGKRTKIKHDTSKLVDHIETEEHHGILESVDKILTTQNKHIVTEL